ncbi:DNA repair exonuclease [Sinimarinibacterium sp. CAU 1509]|uniref:metallophosphoesterase family protein n=1 Tax=Sinimarinibacterium sp. CAU 1509 TaxID=2562283 RepID=UPI0010AC604F|nr:DNA repair exonuclease [Sinimarinibacterium sp. CAU 1509]TJY57201.1 DNA repair exonuclease [Sinimarinibacterium sp. CAU 1509]
MKLLHTADLQLGLKLHFLPPETAARMRSLRFATLRRIAELARQEQVDCVLIAGDVLEDNALKADTLQQATDALACFDGIPVIMIPGNHDAGTADSALARLELPKGVVLATRRESIAVGDAAVYPCPLMRRHEMDDPTAWLPARQPGEGIRIAMAHGGVINFAQNADSETPNLIDANAIVAKGFDYVAMGDWHGTFRYNDRVWYSGAHEATRHKEVDPGNVLLVEIAAPGAVPVVTPVPVASARWISRAIEFTDDAQVEELGAWFGALPERSHTLVALSLSGALTLGARDALDVLLADNAERLAYLRHDAHKVFAQPTEADLAAMNGESFMAAALARLQGSADDAAPDALRLMYRLQQEAANASV